MTAPLAIDATVRRGGFELQLAATVAPGTTLGVLGPNGAGKTTLLRTICGLTSVTAGSVRLGDRVLDDAESGRFVPPERRRVGVVFQDYRLFPHLSVIDNVAFGPRSAGASRRVARARAGQWLDRLDLGPLGSRRPGQLSGGQAQRVALARALAAEPEVLLFDEPLAALDVGTRFGIRTELRSHLAQFAGPVVMVTHDPVEALVMADDLLVIEAGRLAQRDRPAQVARHPRTPYIARLVGLNLYPGRLDERTGVVALAAGGSLVVTAAAEEPTPYADGGAVHVVLAPSAITVHTERPTHSSTRNVWAGHVRGLEPLGDRIRLDVEGPPDALVDVTQGAVAELRLTPGTPVWLSAKATETHAFPAS